MKLMQQRHDVLDAVRVCDEDENVLECFLLENPPVSRSLPPVFEILIVDEKPMQARKNQKQLRNFLKVFRRLFDHRSLPKSSSSVEEASVASTSASSVCSSLDDDDDSTSLMRTRLLGHDFITESDFCFEVDRVSKEMLSKNEKPAQDTAHITHVKTGVWEVRIMDDAPFYVVTGVRMSDRVDTKRLRKVILSGKAYPRRPKITMAPTPIAQELTGYQSGTMAPICHGTSMKLFFDQDIVDDSDDDALHRLFVGSGAVGKCLSIPLDKFLEISRANDAGVEVTPLSKKINIVRRD